MCGIAGIALFGENGLPDLSDRLLAMQRTMIHRGPDDSGIFVSPDGRVGLANRRLAIRDLSSAGHMPMASQDGSLWITYNGEIYNTDELRPLLEKQGYLFKSDTDTEVILNGYQAWGPDVVHRLRGMFAFAIVKLNADRSSVDCIFLARDRLGIKPLYFSNANGAFCFASELKSILASRLVSRSISAPGLVGYLSLGSVPSPWTIYDEISALESGSTMLWRGGTVESSRYWALPSNISEERPYHEFTEEVRFLLEDSVRSHLVSDVPIGAFLSGGLDSSAIVALMRKVTTGAIRTCSMVFDEKEYNEGKYARSVSQAVGSEHYERVITISDVIGELDSILYAMDQPTLDGVNTYFVAQTARQAGLTVALSGLGGDELFGGYPNTFRGVPQMLQALKVLHIIPGGNSLGGALTEFLGPNRGWGRIGDAIRRPVSLGSAYLTRRGLFSSTEIRGLVPPDVWQEAARQFNSVSYVSMRASNGNPKEPYKKSDMFAWVSRAELSTYTQHQLLRDTDIMSMIHSVEVRVPFLDHRLVEFVLRLPALTKVRGWGPKPLLVGIMDHQIPSCVRYRKGKRGFTFPFDQWLRADLKDRSLAILSELKSQNLIKSDGVDKVFADYHRRVGHWSRLWALVALGSIAENT